MDRWQMTVPIERTNAVLMAETLLLELCDPAKTPRVPSAIRRRARSVLRHFPTKFDMDIISDREDGNDNPLSYKVFGNGFK